MNTVMKGILGGVAAALIILPLQSAQAWDNGSARGGDYHSGSNYYRGYRGDDGPGYSRGYRGYDRSGYPREYRENYYGHRGYYGRHWHGDRDSTGAIVAGVALGAIIGAAIINSVPPPPVMLPPPPPPW